MLNKRARKARERELAQATADLARRDAARMHGTKLADHVSAAVASAYSLAPVLCRTPRAFDGHTPLIVREGDTEAMVERGEAVATFRGQGAGGCGRSRLGRSERTRDGGQRFAPDRNANASRALRRDSAHEYRARKEWADHPTAVLAAETRAAASQAIASDLPSYALALALDVAATKREDAIALAEKRARAREAAAE